MTVSVGVGKVKSEPWPIMEVRTRVVLKLVEVVAAMKNSVRRPISQ